MTGGVAVCVLRLYIGGRARLRCGGDGGLGEADRDRGSVSGGGADEGRRQHDSAEGQRDQFGFRRLDPAVDFPEQAATRPVGPGMVEVGVLPGGGVADRTAVEAQLVLPHVETVVVPIGRLHHVFERQRRRARPVRVVHASGPEAVVGISNGQVQVRCSARGVHHNVGIKGYADLDGLADAVGAGGGQRS